MWNFRHFVLKCTKTNLWYSLNSFRKACSGTVPEPLVLPMPQLSPNMTKGFVSRWLKKEGEIIARFDPIMEVKTLELIEEGFKVEGENEKTLVVESEDDGFMAKLLVKEGEMLPVGAPVGLIVEDSADIPKLSAYTVPTSNIYDDSQPHVRSILWQSYLKHSSEASNAGCM